MYRYIVNRLLSEFFAGPTELGRTTTRTGRPISMLFGAVEIIKLKNTIDGNPKAYQGPVAILVNEGSASGSELFAGAMQAVENPAQRVGRRAAARRGPRVFRHLARPAARRATARDPPPRDRAARASRSGCRRRRFAIRIPATRALPAR